VNVTLQLPCEELDETARSVAQAGKWTGELAVEGRLFPQTALGPEQERANISLSFEPEYYLERQDGKQSFTFTTFFRLDHNDPDSTYLDIRELTWQKNPNAWELRVGIRKVFWGVTESQHLVDVINQTDFVENLDGEDKLGQPMTNFAWIQDWGTLDFFVLPGFRERTFRAPRTVRPSLSRLTSIVRSLSPAVVGGTSTGPPAGPTHSACWTSDCPTLPARVAIPTSPASFAPTGKRFSSLATTRFINRASTCR